MQEEEKVKKVITAAWPFLLLVLALTFMTQFKQIDDLTDNERYDIRNYVKAAEAKSDRDTDTDTASADEPDSSVASSNIEVDEVDPNMTYKITDDGETVTVYDDNGPVNKIPLEKWKENIEDYYAMYGLGS